MSVGAGLAGASGVGSLLQFLQGNKDQGKSNQILNQMLGQAQQNYQQYQGYVPHYNSALDYLAERAGLMPSGSQGAATPLGGETVTNPGAPYAGAQAGNIAVTDPTTGQPTRIHNLPASQRNNPQQKVGGGMTPGAGPVNVNAAPQVTYHPTTDSQQGHGFNDPFSQAPNAANTSPLGIDPATQQPHMNIPMLGQMQPKVSNAQGDANGAPSPLHQLASTMGGVGDPNGVAGMNGLAPVGSAMQKQPGMPQAGIGSLFAPQAPPNYGAGGIAGAARAQGMGSTQVLRRQGYQQNQGAPMPQANPTPTVNTQSPMPKPPTAPPQAPPSAPGPPPAPLQGAQPGNPFLNQPQVGGVNNHDLGIYNMNRDDQLRNASAQDDINRQQYQNSQMMKFMMGQRGMVDSGAYAGALSQANQQANQQYGDFRRNLAINAGNTQDQRVQNYLAALSPGLSLGGASAGQLGNVQQQYQQQASQQYGGAQQGMGSLGQLYMMMQGGNRPYNG